MSIPIIKRVQQRVPLLALRCRNRVVTHPVAHRLRALRQGRIGPALAREEGQGLLEYIIAIAGVFVVAAVVLALYRAIQTKYGEATTSVNSLSITAP
jgi:hypothetical protein